MVVAIGAIAIAGTAAGAIARARAVPGRHYRVPRFLPIGDSHAPAAAATTGMILKNQG